MADFNTGVSGYVKAVATVVTWFPIDEKGRESCCCDACRFFQRNSKRCGLTYDVIPDERYVGRQCPLKRVNEED